MNLEGAKTGGIMYPDISKIRAILLSENYVSEADSKAADAVATTGDEYIEALIAQDSLTPPLLGQALAEFYNVPYIDLSISPPQKESVLKLPEPFARQNRVLLLKEGENALALASDAPDKVDKSALATMFPRKALRIAFALPEQLDEGFSLYEQPLETRFSAIIEHGARVAPEVVDEIIKDALVFRASDIHFEPRDADVLIRFRIDGSLREAGKLPRQYYENILNRIKVESGMRIDEHLSSQDGALQREFDHVRADLRVSLIPTVEGEKVAMRVLGSYVKSFTLADIGLSGAHRQQLSSYANGPYGMILAVGPTGSGKTTTLYSIVKMLNKPNVNITSIEDPVEYKIAGVNQILVREQAHMTFARGLRSIVRQDPNIILVGEIRDNETAEISVNAALTGHLLLSTLHANDAATAIPRLIDMGIEPFLLASTLRVIIAQRLVRKVCRNCRYSQPASDALRELKNGRRSAIAAYFSPTDNVYSGKGCHVCSGSGYMGRTAIFEFIGVTPDVQELIMQRPTNRDITLLASKQGQRTMFEDGIAKVKTGITTLSEVLRVVEPQLERM